MLSSYAIALLAALVFGLTLVHVDRAVQDYAVAQATAAHATLAAVRSAR